MSKIYLFWKKITDVHLPYRQVLCVFLAFAVMGIISFLMASKIERIHLERESEAITFFIESQLDSDLRELEAMLKITSETIRRLLIGGADFEEISSYITDITRFGRDEAQIAGFLTIFAMLDTFKWPEQAGFNGIAPDMDWVSILTDGSYIPQEREWYKVAVEANGEVGVTEPYINIIGGVVSITYARCIFDNYGNRIAIVCLDVSLDRLHEFSRKNRDQYNNDWMLFDKNLKIIAHFDSTIIGLPLREVTSGLAEFADELEIGMEIAGRRVVNHRGESRFYTVRKLKNGWHLVVTTMENSYHENLKNIKLFLVLFGLFLSAGLSAILLHIHRDKLRAEKRSQIMLNMAPFGVIFLDNDYKIVDCNQEAMNMFGVTDREEYKRKFHSFSPAYQPNGVSSDEWRVRCLEDMFEAGGGQFEWMHQRPDGEMLPCEISIVPAAYEGQTIIMAYMRDLSETKAAIAEKDKAIEEKNALGNLKNIMNGLDVMIYVTDPVTSEILFMNNSMKQHYKITDDCVGQLCYTVLQKNLIERCSFCPCFQLDKDPDKLVVWEEHSTLTNRIYRNTDRYISWPDGKVVHMQHSVDTTELVAAKEFAERSSRYKSSFLANMSHEIRTPMNAILGIAEIRLQDKTLTRENEEAYGKIYESGDLLLNIINDILDLSKIEAGKLELIPVRYDIPSLINDTAQLNRLRYESKPIGFNLFVDENTPHDLFGDELRIKQILNNILSNAFKYTLEGTVSFAVSCESHKNDDNVTIIFRVTDTGQGMTEDQITKLFDEYTRFYSDNTRTTVGTGLGMSITKRLVDMMKGEITVSSVVDKGSTFTVRVPQKRVGDTVCGSDLAQKLRDFNYQSDTISRKSNFIREYMPYGSVLVVDDVESNLYVIKGMLAPYGLKVEALSSGFDAIEKIKEGSVYDIIFMDHMMPKMDGIETVKIIRGMGYGHLIVALTANALVGRAQMFLQNGFDAFISKPIDSRELNHVLNEFIRNKKPQEIVEAARQQQKEIEKENSLSSKRMENTSDIKKFFVHDAEKALNVLDGIDLTNMDESETESYVVTIHGMKSALMNIGENELSAVALRLEKAGNDKNISILTNETPAFINELKSLIDKFKPAEENIAVEVSADDLAYFSEKLQVIKTSCSAFDKSSAKAALNELRKRTWPGHMNAVLDEISVCLLHSSFKKAAALAEEFKV